MANDSTPNDPIIEEPQLSGQKDITLTNQQQAFLRAINEMDIQLGAMYKGSLVVLADNSNPDRYSQAANSLREVMHQIVKIRGGSTLAHDTKIWNAINRMKAVYEKRIEHTGCFSGGTWEGVIDEHLSAILISVNELIGKMQENDIGRLAEIKNALNSMDPSGRPLPENILNELAKKWYQIYLCVESIKHHSSKYEPDVIIDKSNELEKLVLARIAPKTYEDHKVIDDLIKEVEGDDN